MKEIDDNDDESFLNLSSLGEDSDEEDEDQSFERKESMEVARLTNPF
jgi:hypothetical protein